jgi:hypothetical protein
VGGELNRGDLDTVEDVGSTLTRVPEDEVIGLGSNDVP